MNLVEVVKLVYPLQPKFKEKKCMPTRSKFSPMCVAI